MIFQIWTITGMMSPFNHSIINNDHKGITNIGTIYRFYYKGVYFDLGLLEFNLYQDMINFIDNIIVP